MIASSTGVVVVFAAELPVPARIQRRSTPAAVAVVVAAAVQKRHGVLTQFNLALFACFEVS